MSNPEDMIVRQFHLSPARKALLEKWKRGRLASTRQSIARRHQRDGAPLSYSQQQQWILHQLAPDSPFYNAYTALSFSGPLKIELLERALYEIVQRHESLRTIFCVQEDQPVQMIEIDGEFRLPFVDVQLLSPAQRDAELQRLAREETQYPFDLEHGPLFRALLLGREKHEHVLVLTMHHIISDGISMGVFGQELTALYDAFSSGLPAPLPDLPIQYADFAIWQRQRLQGEHLSNRLAYWRQQLNGIAPLELPTDHPRPPVQTFSGARQHFQIAPSVFAGLKALGQREGTTLFTLLLAAFDVLLFRYTKQTSIAVGTPFANRSRPETEGLIGSFVNTLVLRAELSSDLTFSEFSKQVSATVQNALAYQDVPFELIVAELRPERDLSRSVLFQVLFNLQKMPVENMKLANLRLTFPPVENATAKFDLSFELFETEQELNGVVEYSTDLFEPQTIQRLLACYLTLLEGVVTDSHQRIGELPLLRKEERERILLEWNNTRMEHDSGACFPSIFSSQAELTPDAIALVCEQEHITYQTLNQQANQLAHHLRTLGVKVGVRVGICVERSFAMIVGLLGILKAGGAYVPLDPEYPQERLGYMLQQAHAQVLVTQESLRTNVAHYSENVVCLDVDQEAISQQPQTNPPHSVSAEDMAYVIFTSGSTGQPKGAGVYHRGLSNLLRWYITDFAITAADKTLLITSLSFDLTQKNIFAPLMVGGTVCLPASRYHDIALLRAAIFEKKVTLLNCTPSMFYPFVDDVDQEALRQLHSLRYLFLGGEPIAAQRFLQWMQDAGCQTQIVNTYGPTECSDVVAFYRLASKQQFLDAVVPIGHPIANVQLVILDENLQLVSPSMIGELYIAGECVGAGYINDTHLTAERFLSNPYPELPGELLYRTGDLACYREDGAIEYRGRLDQQVKVRGFRIELEEIEALLAQYIGVRECTVLAWEDEGGDKRLVAYVVSANPATPPSSTELRLYLQERLPNYMVPSFFVGLKSLPLTPSGKVDRRVLPAPARNQLGTGKQVAVANTPVEEMLLGIYRELLQIEQVGLHDNFFELGGHSLLAIQVTARIRKMMQIEVPLRNLFEAPAVAALARRVELQLRNKQAAGVLPPVPVSREQFLPLSFAQQRMWFLHQAAAQSFAYNLPLALKIQGRLKVSVLATCLQEIVQRHEILRATFPLQQGQPAQAISPVMPLRLKIADLQAVDKDERLAEFEQLSRTEMLNPFDLSCGPLLRLWLLRLDDDEHILFLVLHHIIFDAWSIGILLNELSVLYQAYSQGFPAPLPPLPIQYADFAYWQRSWLKDEVLESSIDYWKKQLGGATALKLPTDRPRPKNPNNRGATYTFMLPMQLSQDLLALSRREGVTLFMTLLTAFQILLSRYTQQRDIVVGTDMAGRTHVETEQLIGFFVNLLVLRTKLDTQETFREVLRDVRATVINAYAHQDIPFEKLVDVLKLERTSQQVPLVDVLFVMQNTAQATPGSQDLTLNILDIETQTAKFDLSLFVEERAAGIAGFVSYRVDLFARSRIVSLCESFKILLQSIVTSPDASVEELDIYSEEEKEQQRSQDAQYHKMQQSKLKAAKRHVITNIPSV